MFVCIQLDGKILYNSDFQTNPKKNCLWMDIKILEKVETIGVYTYVCAMFSHPIFRGFLYMAKRKLYRSLSEQTRFYFMKTPAKTYLH
jgi:hypothetical protein